MKISPARNYKFLCYAKIMYAIIKRANIIPAQTPYPPLPIPHPHPREI